MAWRGLNAGSCTPLPLLVCPQPRLEIHQLRECRFYQAGRQDRPRRPPSVQSPFAQLGCYLRWGDVWEDITPPSSLIWAHAPLPLGSLLLRLLALFGESLQVVTSPCCPRQLPDVISNSLFLDAGSPTPAVHRVLAPVSSTVSSAFPTEKWVGFPQLSRLKRLRARGDFRGCRYFVMFRPPSLLAPQIVPTVANTPARQPGLLRPSRTRFVAFPRIGYANRPKTGNWRCGDLHPARLRPCRLLLFYLPPYSPDFNPIEQLFAKLKAFLRKTKARTVDRLLKAIASFLKTVSKGECKAYLANSGYA